MSTEIPKLKKSRPTGNKHTIQIMIKTLNSLLSNTPESLDREKVKQVSKLVKNLDNKWTTKENEGASCEIQRLEKLRIDLEKKFQIQDRPVMETIL
jgi:hypothetical protein